MCSRHSGILRQTYILSSGNAARRMVEEEEVKPMIRLMMVISKERRKMGYSSIGSSVSTILLMVISVEESSVCMYSTVQYYTWGEG